MNQNQVSMLNDKLKTSYGIRGIDPALTIVHLASTANDYLFVTAVHKETTILQLSLTPFP